MHRPSFLALLAAACALSPLHALAQSDAPRFELELGGSTDRPLAAGGVFVPFRLGDGTIMFGDGRLNIDVEGRVSGSLGGGVRTTLPGDLVLGASLFADFSHSGYGNTYQQISAGLEALAGDWEFRLNGYVPFGDTETEESSLATARVAGGAFRINRGYEVALHGIDAELGVRLPVFTDDAPSLKLLAGAYALDSRLTGLVHGLSLRTELSLDLGDTLPGGQVTFGAGLSHDSLDGAGGHVFVRLSAPIGGEGNAGATANAPLYQRVERAGGVHLRAGDFGADETAFGSDGSNLGRVLQVSSSDGDADALNGLIDAAGEGAIILVAGDLIVDASLLLSANQTLIGGGGTIDLTDSDGQHVIYRNPGAATTLHGGGIAPLGFMALSAPVLPDVIVLADGVTISTLSIVGGNDAIVGAGVAGVTIANVAISGVAGNGIRLVDASDIRIADSTISDLFLCESSTDCEWSIYEPNYVPHAAINVLGVDGLTVQNVDITNATYGIFVGSRMEEVDWEFEVANQSTDIAIRDVNITNSRREGLLIVSATDIDVDGFAIDNLALERSMDLVVLQASQDITFRNARLLGGSNGLMFGYSTNLPTGPTGNVEVSNVHIEGSARSGIYMNPSHDVTFTDVTVKDTGQFGIYLYGDSWGMFGGPVKDVDLGNLRVEQAGLGTVYFGGAVENLDGAVTSVGAQPVCGKSPWLSPDFTQGGGHSLTVNGTAITPADVEDCAAISPF